MVVLAVGDAVSVGVIVAGVTYAVSVAVGLVFVLNGWAVIEGIGDTVGIGVAFADVADAIAVGVCLVSVRCEGAVVEIVGNSIEIDVVALYAWASAGVGDNIDGERKRPWFERRYASFGSSA